MIKFYSWVYNLGRQCTIKKDNKKLGLDIS